MKLVYLFRMLLSSHIGSELCGLDLAVAENSHFNHHYSFGNDRGAGFMKVSLGA
jgi:hypothetical protein